MSNRMLVRVGRGAGGAFTPLSLLPSLWLDASDPATTFQDSALTTPATADADPVGGWKDKSGNNLHWLQATASKRPTLKTNIQNGRAVVRPDGTDDFLSQATGVGAQPATVFAVWKESGTHSYVISGATTINALIGGFTSNLETFQTPRISVGATSGTQLNIHAVTTSSGGGTATYRNNAAVTTDPTGWNPFPFSTLFDDGNRLGTSAAKGDLGELLVFPSVLSAGNLAAVFGYLDAKWAAY